MADLTDEQKQAVSQWAEEGATLNDIQSRLKKDFGLTMTYMEARLLAVDLEVHLKDKTVKPKAEPEAAAVPSASAEAMAESDEEAFADPGEEAFSDEGFSDEGVPAEGAVPFVMAADELIVPGALVSGSATFSDGTKTKWFLDQIGRLRLKADKPGYQPPQVDVPKFQKGLEQILAKMGLY
jgi:hypothetical protein